MATPNKSLTRSARSVMLEPINVPKASDILAERLRGLILSGKIPEGERLPTERELVEDSVERAAVDRALELRGEGASLRRIAAQLEAEGHKPKRGGRWHPETLRRVLARPAVR